MNQFKSIRELGKVRNAARSQDSMLVTSRRYHSPDAANKEEWAAHAMKHDMDRALIRSEDKGLLAQVEAQSVSAITEEAIITLWQSIPRQHQANAAFYMNVVTHNKLLDKFRNSPYKLLTRNDYQGFQLLNKPILFSNDMPCGSSSNEVAILYGDFGQVEVLQQGADLMQEHECIDSPARWRSAWMAMHRCGCWTGRLSRGCLSRERRALHARKARPRDQTSDRRYAVYH